MIIWLPKRTKEEMTMLEFATFRALNCKDYTDLAGVTQKHLDAMTPEILERVSPEDIGEHMRAVYDETTHEYANNPHTRFVTDDLIEFMALLEEGDRVLDIGCGPGRDTWFMTSSNTDHRALLMQRETNGRKTIDIHTVPTKKFEVTAVDTSQAMLEMAANAGKTIIVQNKIVPAFLSLDMHHDMDHLASHTFQGVWSCASFLTHTPQAWVEPVLSQIVRVLARGGIFAVSYTQRQPGQAYDYLKLSTTGRIKYFSHPKASDIVELAKRHGLSLERETTSDYVSAGKVVKDLFVSQFFKKR